MKKFRASNGKYYTKQLFWEEWINLTLEGRMIDPPFSLHKDKPNTINMGKAYVHYRDPTGRKVADNLLDGDYNLWQALLSCSWFVKAKEIWDRELDDTLKSEALEKIRELMLEGQPAQQLAAAKYLANQEYRKGPNVNTKGRPKKEDIDKAARDMAATERDLEEDLKRIQGVANG